eukprot:scaffold1727_cov150-Amphora_coffeaeformis.AAC.1
MASLSSTTISLGQSERDYILAGCRQDCRLDGRTCHEVRPYVLVEAAEDPLILSHGSARLQSANACHDGGSTELLCSVKAELVQPALHHPEKGVVEIHVDTLAAGISRRLCDDLEATLTYLLGNSVVDTHALCVLPHVYAWRLQIDVYVVSHAGSLLDAASRVVRAALQSTKLPMIDVLPTASHESMYQESTDATSSTTASASVVVDGDIHHASPLPGVDDGPVIVTVTVLQSLDANNRTTTSLVLDATVAEEACAVAQVHVSVVPKKGDKPTITAVRKTGTGGLPVALLPEITKLAIQSATNDDAFVHKASNEPSSTWLLQGLYQLQ